MKFSVTAPEPFARFADRPRRALARAVRVGVAAGTNGFKLELRQVIARVLGERMGNAIGGAVYPKEDRPSLGTAGVVFPRGQGAENIIRAFDEGEPIRRDGAGWLAIPVIDNLPVLGRGVRKTPRAVEAFYGRPLRYVPPNVVDPGGDLALLVLDGVVRGRRRGVKNATRRRIAQGREVRSVVMFLLMPEVRPGKRFDVAAVARRWADRIPDLIDQAMPGN